MKETETETERFQSPVLLVIRSDRNLQEKTVLHKPWRSHSPCSPLCISDVKGCHTLNPKAYKFINRHTVAAYPCCRGLDPKNTMARAFQGPCLLPARLAGSPLSRLAMVGVKMDLKKERLFPSARSRGSGRGWLINLALSVVAVL